VKSFIKKNYAENKKQKFSVPISGLSDEPHAKEENRMTTVWFTAIKKCCPNTVRA
jgi:hypothetical protein